MNFERERRAECRSRTTSNVGQDERRGPRPCGHTGAGVGSNAQTTPIRLRPPGFDVSKRSRKTPAGCYRECESGESGESANLARDGKVPPICQVNMPSDQDFRVEAKGLEPSNLLTASQALYQLSYAPEGSRQVSSRRPGPWIGSRADGPLRRITSSSHGTTPPVGPIPEQCGSAWGQMPPNHIWRLTRSTTKSAHGGCEAAARRASDSAGCPGDIDIRTPSRAMVRQGHPLGGLATEPRRRPGRGNGGASWHLGSISSTKDSQQRSTRAQSSSWKQPVQVHPRGERSTSPSNQTVRSRSSTFGNRRRTSMPSEPH
jgi:hypothetical protein